VNSVDAKHSRINFLLDAKLKHFFRLLITDSIVEPNQFTDNLIMPLFNYGTGSYDEYLLLKYFKTAMEMEVDQKVGNMHELSVIDLVSTEQVGKFIL
jgi:hypothetical protein